MCIQGYRCRYVYRDTVSKKGLAAAWRASNNTPPPSTAAAVACVEATDEEEVNKALENSEMPCRRALCAAYSRRIVNDVRLPCVKPSALAAVAAAVDVGAVGTEMVWAP